METRFRMDRFKLKWYRSGLSLVSGSPGDVWLIVYADELSGDEPGSLRCARVDEAKQENGTIS